MTVGQQLDTSLGIRKELINKTISSEIGGTKEQKKQGGGMWWVDIEVKADWGGGLDGIHLINEEVKKFLEGKISV